ncbi:CdiA family toxin C-terminal domain-containing protein, partial [Thermoactinomyces mirandus]
KWINNRNIPSFAQSFVRSGNSAAMTAPKRVGDTPFGQWLQKFAAEGGGSRETISSITVRAMEFEEGLEEHLIRGEGIGKGKKGVIGAHNMDEFYHTLKETGININDLIISKEQHPKFPGLYNIKYKIPALTYDKSGNLVSSGQFKVIKLPKTVYDPKVYLDQQIIQWGKEAMREGIDANRIKRGVVEGYSRNGMKFAGRLSDKGKIKIFYPVF